MSDKRIEEKADGKSRALNRRKFVKALGGSSVASMGLMSIQTSRAEPVGDDKVDQLINSQQVQVILQELNHPDLGDVSREMIQIDDQELEKIEIPVSFGDLYHTQTESGETSVQFVFNDDLEKTFYQELPSKYQQVPAGSNPVLLVDESDTVFRRSATESELQMISEFADISDESMASTGSNTDGFLIASSNDEGVVEKRRLSINKKFDNLTDELGADVSVSQKDVTVQRLVTARASCETWIYRCVAGTAGCGACSSTCLGAPTGIAIIPCVACIKGVCELVAGTACAAAVGTCLG